MKVGRNEPCPCGSGKKFKKCHIGASPTVNPPADVPVRFAGQLSVPRLYHYQDFDLTSSADHTARLVDILQEHRIWCSNPAHFNDPWDCKPYFDPALLDSSETCRAAAEALIATRKGGAELDHVDARLRNDPDSSNR
jgi:hypothetical protein